MWLGIRVRRAGLRTAFDPGARVEHAVFARGPAGYVGEFRRLRYFPAAVALMPELRTTFLHGRVFLSPATRDFDLALAGLGLAAARRSPLPLVAALPWARRLAARSLPHGRRAPLVAAAEVAAQAVGAYSLLSAARGTAAPCSDRPSGLVRVVHHVRDLPARARHQVEAREPLDPVEACAPQQPPPGPDARQPEDHVRVAVGQVAGGGEGQQAREPCRSPRRR